MFKKIHLFFVCIKKRLNDIKMACECSKYVYTCSIKFFQYIQLLWFYIEYHRIYYYSVYCRFLLTDILYFFPYEYNYGFPCYVLPLVRVTTAVIIQFDTYYIVVQRVHILPQDHVTIKAKKRKTYKILRMRPI